MKNLSDKDLLKLVKDTKDVFRSANMIVQGIRDIIRMFKG